MTPGIHEVEAVPVSYKTHTILLLLSIFVGHNSMQAITDSVNKIGGLLQKLEVTMNLTPFTLENRSGHGTQNVKT